MYLKVLINPLDDETKLVEKLSEIKDVEFFHYFPENNEINIEKEKEWLLDVGITEAFNTSQYLEALGTTSHRPGDIKLLIQKYLDRTIKTNKLIIIDRYFFPNNHDATYPNFVVDILDKYLSIIDEITFITSPRYNSVAANSIKSLLFSKKETLTINIKHTDDFHDRFWISNYNGKGLFLGTSLNGFGRKYALIDYINTADVRLIIAELNTQGLI